MGEVALTVKVRHGYAISSHYYSITEEKGELLKFSFPQEICDIGKMAHMCAFEKTNALWDLHHSKLRIMGPSKKCIVGF